MGSIYAGADDVLVLDRELLQTNSGTLETNLARIICSVWMCRSWTLQEGVLARNCGFLFHDAVLYADQAINQMTWSSVELMHGRVGPLSQLKHHSLQVLGQPRWIDYQQHGRTLQLYNVAREMESLEQMLVRFFDEEFFGLHHSEQRPHERFVHVWNALAGRSTSKPEDLLLIVANLLSFSTERLLRIDESERLPAIIHNLRYIPFTLFLLHGPELVQDDAHRNNWMPTHMTRQMLRPTPYLKLSLAELKFQNPHSKYSRYEPIFHEQLSFHFTPEVLFDNVDTISLPPAAPTDSTLNQHTAVTVWLPQLAFDPLNVRDCQGTCFAIPKWTIGSECPRIGAMFKVMRWKKVTHSTKKITLRFISSVEICRRSVVDTSGSEHCVYRYTTELVSRDTDVVVTYGKYPLAAQQISRSAADTRQTAHVKCPRFEIAGIDPRKVRTNSSCYSCSVVGPPYLYSLRFPATSLWISL
jgi:hypothetical protein